jgi:hypothetical protein
MSPRDPYPPTSIRLDPSIKDAVARRAEAEGRSLSAQISFVLRNYVESTPEPKRKSRK